MLDFNLTGFDHEVGAGFSPWEDREQIAMSSRVHGFFGHVCVNLAQRTADMFWRDFNEKFMI